MLGEISYHFHVPVKEGINTVGTILMESQQVPILQGTFTLTSIVGKSEGIGGITRKEGIAHDARPRFAPAPYCFQYTN